MPRVTIVLVQQKLVGSSIATSVLTVMASAEEPQKASSDPSLQKGKAWIDVAAMVVLFVVLIVAFYFW